VLSKTVQEEKLHYIKEQRTLLEVSTVCALAEWSVIIGFNVYSSFESASVARTGIMPVRIQAENNY
jgi:hypothetical protein